MMDRIFAWVIVVGAGILLLITLGRIYEAGYDDGLAYGLTHQDDTVTTINCTLLSESGFVETSNIKTENWQEKYDELWKAYKHVIWHYDAQAENLRRERDNLWNRLYGNVAENITIVIDKPASSSDEGRE